MGIPVLDGLGISGDGAHAVHEHIEADDIARRGALIGGLLLAIDLTTDADRNLERKLNPRTDAERDSLARRSEARCTLHAGNKMH